MSFEDQSQYKMEKEKNKSILRHSIENLDKTAAKGRNLFLCKILHCLINIHNQFQDCKRIFMEPSLCFLMNSMQD